MTTAMMRVGTRVETRPESEEDPPLRAEPTFESVCGNIFQLSYLERVGRRWCFDLRLWERGRSRCPIDEVSVDQIHYRIWISLTRRSMSVREPSASMTGGTSTYWGGLVDQID